MIVFTKNRLRGFSAFLLFIIIGVSSVYYFHQPGVDRSLRLAPLANGWCSQYAAIHMGASGLIEKYKVTVSNDKGVGRFRPSSFIFTSLSFALTPYLHGRGGVGDQQRAHDLLMTGDLRLTSFILLGAIVCTLVAVSLLFYKYTGSLLLAVAPILFMASSPALTGNLLQNYIDSQEIPLVFFLGLWMLFFFTAPLVKNIWVKYILAILSLFFLLLLLLTKETTCVVLASLVAVFLYNCFNGQSVLFDKLLLTANILLSIIFVGYLYFSIFSGNEKYGSGFNLENLDRFRENFLGYWDAISQYSMHNYVSVVFVVIALILLVFYRDKSMNGLPVHRHGSLFIFLVSAGYGFLIIMLPWEYRLVKYMLPTALLMSFAIIYSVYIICNLLFSGLVRRTFFILGVSGYLFLFYLQYSEIKNFTSWYYETANYSLSVVDGIVDGVDASIKDIDKKKINVFVEHGTHAEWERFIPWGKLHLLRILNIEKKYNVVDYDNNIVLNVKMPTAELSSFRYDPSRKNIYLTNRREELSQKKFDVLYKGVRADDSPPAILEYNVGERPEIYILQGRALSYTNDYGLPGFKLQKYVPVVRVNKE